jgi:hypothetical protein
MSAAVEVELGNAARLVIITALLSVMPVRRTRARLVT